MSAVLLWSLERTLRLLHPIMPFVTEEIWSLMPGEDRGLLAVADWPEADTGRYDEAAEDELGRLIEAVTSLRRYRDEVGAKAASAVRGRLVADGYDPLRDQLARLARFEWVDGDSPDGDVLATVPIPGGGVQVLPSDAFDAGEARAGSRSGASSCAQRSSGRSASSPTRASWRKRPRRSSRRNAASSRSTARRCAGWRTA